MKMDKILFVEITIILIISTIAVEISKTALDAEIAQLNAKIAALDDKMQHHIDKPHLEIAPIASSSEYIPCPIDPDFQIPAGKIIYSNPVYKPQPGDRLIMDHPIYRPKPELELPIKNY
jgi:hypothetical protein